MWSSEWTMAHALPPSVISSWLTAPDLMYSIKAMIAIGFNLLHQLLKITEDYWQQEESSGLGVL
jgi:hypothetical protein